MPAQKEKWAQITEAPEYYISSEWRLKSTKYWKEKILKPEKTSLGYLKAQLITNWKRKRIFMHVLVARYFLPKDIYRTEVNHINWDRTDNRVENLEYSNRIENVRHSKYIIQKKTPVITKQLKNKYRILVNWFIS